MHGSRFRYGGAVAGFIGVSAYALYRLLRHTRLPVSSATALMGVPVPKTVPFIVMTDLEPDDMLALAVLKRRGFQPTVIIAGEGCAHNKAIRARQYADDLGWLDTFVVCGNDSDKVFPNECADLDASQKDATHYGSRINFPFASDTADIEVNVLQRGLRGPSGVAEPTVLCLKPPRELVMLESGGRKDEAHRLFKKLRLVLYGSFNLREVGYEPVLHWLNPGTTPFKQVVLYENYGGMAGGTKNLNPATVSPCASPVLSCGMEVYEERLRVVAREWDMYILQDCEATCKQIEKENPDWATNAEDNARWTRNHTCASSVRENLGRQIVAADPILALIMDNPKYAKWADSVRGTHIPDGCPYPLFTYDSSNSGTGASPGTSKSVMRFRNLPDEEVLADIGPIWQRVFGDHDHKPSSSLSPRA